LGRACGVALLLWTFVEVGNRFRRAKKMPRIEKTMNSDSNAGFLIEIGLPVRVHHLRKVSSSAPQAAAYEGPK